MSQTTINWDAFSSGQVHSKLWLLDEWERCYPRTAQAETAWILCGWYALLSLLIFTRDRHNIDNIRSFDLDKESVDAANLLNEAWVWQKKFSAYNVDITKLRWQEPELYGSRFPDWVINSACEHLPADLWWSQIRSGQNVILQATDMPHHEHVNRMNSLDQLKSAFPLTTTLFAGEKHFEYPSGLRFTRFMLIGTK